MPINRSKAPSATKRASGVIGKSGNSPKYPCGGTPLRRISEVGAIMSSRCNIGKGKERVDIVLDETVKSADATALTRRCGEPPSPQIEMDLVFAGGIAGTPGNGNPVRR